MAKAPRSLAGDVVAITGGARGIGRATAAALIAQGARVAIGDIDAALAERTAQELGSGTVGLPLDVTNRDELRDVPRRGREPPRARSTSSSTTPGSCRSDRSPRRPTRPRSG